MRKQAPAADCFVPYPASWYLLCASSELTGRPIGRDMLGRRLVAYRTESGSPVVMDARCSHMGADLAGGRVVGDAIRCPFHAWEYGADGRCTRVPGLCGPPAFARQARFPAEERSGYVYFFNGPDPLFPLPFFPGVAPEQVIASRPFRFVGRCPWYMFASHIVDRQHFAAVHDRRLVSEPIIDSPAPFARRNRYTALVEGTSIYDRLLARLVSQRVEITLTTWGGTLFLVTGEFGRLTSRFLIAAQPIEGDRVLAEGIVFAPRGRNRITSSLFQPVNIWVRWLFTRAYLMDEARRLGSPIYSPATMVETDADMVDFFQWLAALPQRRHSEAAPASLLQAEAPPSAPDRVGVAAVLAQGHA